jgi:parallel beta-helix repeat protein
MLLILLAVILFLLAIWGFKKMTVNLSALGGAGQQFFDNNGDPLTGGKLYSYEAGTTTPQVTYTTAAGNVPHSNPIILDAAGRVATGEIWVTASQNYKFVLKTSTEVTLATWDNITGINGTGIATNAINVQYDPAGSGAVATNVQAKLRQTVSVKDFGAVGDGGADDTAAIQAAFDSGALTINVPDGTYKITSTLTIGSNQSFVLTDGATITALATDLGTDPATSGPGIFPGFPRGYAMITNDDHTGGNSNITIEGGNWIVTRNASIRAGAIVDFRKVTQSQIRNLKGNCLATGLYTNSVGVIYALECSYISVFNCSILRSVGCNIFYFQQSSWSKFDNCFAQYTNDSTYTVDSSPFCQVTNSYAYESAGSAITFNSEYGLIQGNTVDASGPVHTIPGVGISINIGHPELIYSGSHTKVIGNTIWGHAKGSGIAVQQAPTTENVVVSGNTVEGIAGGPSSATNGISINGDRTTVVNNQVRNCTVGIFVNCQESTFSGNVANNNLKQGIRVVDRGNTIIGNSVYDNGQDGDAATAFGISLESVQYSKNNVIIGNVCFDSGSDIQKVGIN